MAPLDVAGVVGTWVAASLALIALVGIVGPILIWRASRTERHKAIVTIGLNNYGYVTKGYPFWPGVRLGQRVRAPHIDRPRNFKHGEWKDFDSKRIARGNFQESPASWVSFGAFLDGYALRFGKDGDVAVSEGTAYLPVSKAFLMTFALVGRFSRDRGRKRKIKEKGVREWDKRVSRAGIEFVPSGGQPPTLHGFPPEQEMHGLTGSLYFWRPFVGTTNINQVSWRVMFVGSSLLEPLEYPPDSITLEAMGMLSLGFLPFDEGCYVNVLDPVIRNDDLSDDNDAIEDDQPQRQRAPRHSKNDIGPAANSYRRSISRSEHIRVSRLSNGSQITIVAYELFDITLTGHDVLRFLALQTDTKHLALYETELDGKTRSELRELSEHTFVPVTAPWVRLKSNAPSFREPATVLFIRRAHIQQIALSLLKFPWHPEGYLVPGATLQNDRAQVVDLLSGISERMRPFLIRLTEGVKALDLSREEEKAFLEISETVVRKAASATTRRSLSHALFPLDEFAKHVQHERSEVQEIVGVFILTNEEFRELVYQSARHMTTSASVRLEFDLQAGTLKVPSTFGTVQTFEADMDVLYRNQLQLGAEAKVSVKHSDILKAALRAYVRSSMLAYCYEAEPLTKCFEAITSDVLYMA